MSKRMLIDATHPEETRVAVVDGRKLEEFDVEVASRKQLKGNIYLAKITRVEPSLQAAFVEYGGNRHGFLAFSEIHPDYYRIPLEDREALLAEQAALAREEDAEQEAEVSSEGRWHRRDRRRRRDHDRHEPAPSEASSAGETAGAVLQPTEAAIEETASAEPGEAMPLRAASDAEFRLTSEPFEAEPSPETAQGESEGGESPPEAAHPVEHAGEDSAPGMASAETTPERQVSAPGEIEGEHGDTQPAPSEGEPIDASVADEAPERRALIEEAPIPPQSLETVGGDEVEESSSRRPRPLSRRYKIQDVIKRRQILLVQVTKEERGNKGAALTTYLSLAGRYCVLMPNTDRGGGVSRKITNAGDRKRLKTIIEDLELPAGMAVIVRTAGSERSKPEVKRDFEYLLRLWDEIRELTLRSTAPALIYEEANLIKRAIRDLYTRDIEDILVEGDEAYKAAKTFMRTLTPSHAKRVQQYKDPTMPLFTRYQIENQLDAIHNPVVQLKSGGYIVINQTEALVAIDVNSGRATRERNIEETATKTNLEAADEIARQLRLRDLAGLIVIDFIDMDEARHNVQVERRLKDAMRHDRARIQLGRISPFGLLELSRQRLRPSLFEASTEVCRLCRGTGHVRSTESTALHVLRSIDEEGARQKSAAITVAVPAAVALFILNHKRQSLAELEARQGFRIYLVDDDSLVPPEFRIERLKALAPGDAPPAPVVHSTAPALVESEAEAADDAAAATEVEIASEAPAGRAEGEPQAAQPRPNEARGEQGQGDGERRRGRRRRRRGRDRHGGEGQRDGSRDGFRDGQREQSRDQSRDYPAAQQIAPTGEPQQAASSAGEASIAGPGQPQPSGEGGEQGRRRRRRGRRGGRRRRRGDKPLDERSQEFAPGQQPTNVDDQAWPANRPLTPADFDRPFADEPAPREERRSESQQQPAEPRPEPQPAPGAEPSSSGDAGEANSGPRKRGWWQRVLS